MLHFVDVVPSTMDLAHRMAAEGAPAGDAVVARKQCRGRGQKGRWWSAEPGGLWMSVIGRPRSSKGLDTLSLRVGLAVASVLEELIPGVTRIGLKWPNDLMLGGRKLGGVLSEARWREGECLWVVTGVGINVHNRIDDEVAARAIQLGSVADCPPANELAQPVADAVTGAMRGGPLNNDELTRWQQRDVLLGSRIEAPVPGTAIGINSRGSMQVRNDEGNIIECSVGVVVSED